MQELATDSAPAQKGEAKEKGSPARGAWVQIHVRASCTRQLQTAARFVTASTIKQAAVEETVGEYTFVSFVCRPSIIDTPARNRRPRRRTQPMRARRPPTDRRATTYRSAVSLGRFGMRVTMPPLLCMFCIYLQGSSGKQTFDITCRNWRDATMYVSLDCSLTSFDMKGTTSIRRKFGAGFHSSWRRAWSTSSLWRHRATRTVGRVANTGSMADPDLCVIRAFPMDFHG